MLPAPRTARVEGSRRSSGTVCEGGTHEYADLEAIRGVEIVKPRHVLLEERHAERVGTRLGREEHGERERRRGPGAQHRRRDTRAIIDMVTPGGIDPDDAHRHRKAFSVAHYRQLASVLDVEVEHVL